MGIQKFIKSVKSCLVLKDFKKEDKKKSLTILMEKLNRRKNIIMKSLESSRENKELQEELHIITLQIQKGNKLLTDLSS